MEHEQPMRLYQADLIEIAEEQLVYHAEGWIFAHGESLPEDVKNFLAWCKADLKEQMHCKRAKDHKSFYERREEAKKTAREKGKQYYERLRLEKVLGRDGEEKQQGEKTS